MKYSIKHVLGSLLLLTVFLVMTGCSSMQGAEEEKVHKVVIQVSHPDPAEHTIALNIASNLQKHYGLDNVKIEIVAFGRGLVLLTPKSPSAARVKSLAVQDVTFTACRNTMASIKRKTGKEPKLIEGVGTVQAGVARIIELQEQGYAYTAP